MLNTTMTIQNISNASEYLSSIDMVDVDFEFYKAVSGDDENIYAICYNDKIIGLSNIICDEWGFLYVYIFPEHRGLGYGKEAVNMSEQIMHSSKLRNITTCYIASNECAQKFAKSCGYMKEFSSSYMKYKGTAFDEKELPIRQYQDADFDEAQAIDAEAFHKMRLATGSFPNSVPEAPSAEMQKTWKDTANERYVYIQRNEVIGYAHLDAAELASVSIKVSEQGKGIGTDFIKYLINRLLEKGYAEPNLYCVVGNKAFKLYERLGFQEISCNEYAKKRIQ